MTYDDHSYHDIDVEKDGKPLCGKHMPDCWCNMTTTDVYAQKREDTSGPEWCHCYDEKDVLDSPQEPSIE